MFSGTFKPNALNTSTITVIIFASPASDLDTIAASLAYNILHTALRTRSSSSVLSGPPPLPLPRNTMSSRRVLSPLKRCSTTSITAAKTMLNSNSDSTHSCRSPCVTSNHSESFRRPHAPRPANRHGIGGRRQSSRTVHLPGPELSTTVIGRPSRRPSGGQRIACTAGLSSVGPVPGVGGLRAACRWWIAPAGSLTAPLVVSAVLRGSR